MVSGNAAMMLDCGGEAFRVQLDGPADAPPVLLSNSLSCDLSMWDDQVAAWGDRFRVIRYDGRGQGGSVVSPGPYTMDRLGMDALAVLDALGVPQAGFCGLSMGGMVGLWLLTHAPQRIARAALCNTAAHMGPPSLWDGRIALVQQGGMTATVEPTVTRWFPEAFRARAPGVIDRMRAGIRSTPPEGYAACCAAIRDMDQRDSMRAITNPVLVVVGANDPATTPADGQAIYAAIAGSALVTLEAGHISAVEAPDRFSDVVGSFLVG